MERHCIGTVSYGEKQLCSSILCVSNCCISDTLPSTEPMVSVTLSMGFELMSEKTFADTHDRCEHASNRSLTFFLRFSNKTHANPVVNKAASSHSLAGTDTGVVDTLHTV